MKFRVLCAELYAELRFELRFELCFELRAELHAELHAELYAELRVEFQEGNPLGPPYCTTCRIQISLKEEIFYGFKYKQFLPSPPC